MDSQSSRKAVWVALAANLSIFMVKAVGAWISGSSAMFSEALHSLADMFNSIFLLVGLYLALRPADDEHPFGYGKEVYFWSFMASIFMLGVTSMGSIYKGYHSLTDPQYITDLGLSMAALGVSILVEIYAVYVAMTGVVRDVGVSAKGFDLIPKAFRNVGRVANPTVKFVFFEDLIALAGVLLAALALTLVELTGSTLFDGIVSILIGLLLGGMALMLAKENREMIIGQAAPDSLEQEIGDTALSVDLVTDVHDLKTMYVGPQDLLVNMEIEVSPDTTVEEMDDIVEHVEEQIRRKVPSVKHISIEVMPDDHIQDWQKTPAK
jgi:cation diffusion facilitator family transporter